VASVLPPVVGGEFKIVVAADCRRCLFAFIAVATHGWHCSRVTTVAAFVPEWSRPQTRMGREAAQGTMDGL